MRKIKLDIDVCRKCYLEERHDCESGVANIHVNDSFSWGTAPCGCADTRPSIYCRPPKYCRYKFEHGVAVVMEVSYE